MKMKQVRFIYFFVKGIAEAWLCLHLVGDLSIVNLMSQNKDVFAQMYPFHNCLIAFALSSLLQFETQGLKGYGV